MLDKAEKEKNYAKELKEREQAAGTQQRVHPPLGAVMALSAQDQITQLRPELNAK